MTQVIQDFSAVTHWVPKWTPRSYQKNTMTVDGPWLMVSNKRTEDRPAPQPKDAPFFVSALGNNPAWTVNNDNEKLVITGQRYTVPSGEALSITGWRLWVQAVSATTTYEVLIVINPGASQIVESLLGQTSFNQTGWVNLNLPEQFLEAGLTFDIVLLTRSTTGTSTSMEDWNIVRTNDNGVPADGIANFNNAGRLNIAHVDNGTTDQEVLLDGTVPGDTIEIDGITYEILGTTPFAAYNEYILLPTTRPANGLFTFTFTNHTAQSLDFVDITDHFLSNANVCGFFSDSGYDNIVLDDDAYGIDIEVQEYVASDDWDFASTSGVSGINANVPIELAFVIAAGDTAPVVANGLEGLPISASMNGKKIIDVLARAGDALGTANTTDIQIRKRRTNPASDVDVLSTKVTMVAEFFARDGVVDPDEAEVLTGDVLYADVDAVEDDIEGLTVIVTII